MNERWSFYAPRKVTYVSASSPSETVPTVSTDHSNRVCNQTELEYVMQMLAPSPEVFELIHDSDLGWTDSLSQWLGN